MTFELRVACPACRVEGTRIEIWDGEAPSCRLGLPQATHCRLCGAAEEGCVVGTESPAPGTGCPGCGSELEEAMRDAHRCALCGTSAVTRATAPGAALATSEEIRAHLAAWARAEGLASAAELVDAYFVLPSVDAVADAILRRAEVETSFDVVDYLFSSGGASGGEAVEMREEEAPRTERIPLPRTQRLAAAGPRDELCALAAVAAADGEANVDDRAALARAAERRRVPPLPDADVRVWRPNELEPPPTLADRERVLEEMFQLAWADGEMDESELRVIRDFARAWAIDPERLRVWSDLYSLGDRGAFERWFRRLGLYLFPAR